MSFIKRIPMYGQEERSTPQGDIIYLNRDSIDNPQEGDWRIVRKEDLKHSEIQRYQEGAWSYHGDFGGSFLTGNCVLDDKTKMLYYLDESGNKIVYVRASLIDGGVYLGCIQKGISLVHNGRLEGWRASSTELTSSTYNDGTDTNTDVEFETTTPIQPFYQSPTSFKFYTQTVPSNTKVRVEVLEGTTCWYESISSFDFSLGEGQDVIVGENTYSFNPCLNIASGDQYTIKLYFSNPVEILGINSPPFEIKHIFTYKILTPSKIPQVHASGNTTGVLVSTYVPTYTNVFSFPYVMCEDDSFHKIVMNFNAVYSNPAIDGEVTFSINGVQRASILISEGYNSHTFFCSTPTTEQGISIDAAIDSAIPLETITLNDVFIIIEEI